MQLWIVEHFHLHKKVPVLMNHNTWKNHMLWFTDYGRPVRKSSSLPSPKPTPAPKIFWVRPKHILSATLAQIFRFLWFMPSLGVRSAWYESYTDRKNVTNFLYLVLHWACKVTCYYQLVSSVLFSVLRTSTNVLSKSKSRNCVTWIPNVTKLFLSV